jgi:hypothetical protein
VSGIVVKALNAPVLSRFCELAIVSPVKCVIEEYSIYRKITEKP